MKNKGIFIISGIILCAGILLIVLSGGSKNSGYTVQEEVLQNSGRGNHITVKYPRLQSAEQDFSEVNQQIAQTVAQYLYDSYGQEITDLSLEMEYRVTRQDEKRFSAVMEGLGYVADTAHPNDHLFTINMDLETGARLKLSDMFRLDNAFVEIVKQKFLDQNKEIKQIFESYSEDELLEMLTASDQSGFGAFSYLAGRSVVICLPVAHAAGNHAEVEVPLRELQDFAQIELG